MYHGNYDVSENVLLEWEALFSLAEIRNIDRLRQINSYQFFSNAYNKMKDRSKG